MWAGLDKEMKKRRGLWGKDIPREMKWCEQRQWWGGSGKWGVWIRMAL